MKNFSTNSNIDTWQQVMAHKKNDTRHKGITNNLTSDELDTIIGTVEYFRGNITQSLFDLRVARYRVFNWLAMNVMSADNPRCGSINSTKVLVYSFLTNQGDINKWIDDLRVTDYEIDTEWEKIELEN